MALPYDLYIRFLVTKGYQEPEEISEVLAKHNLPNKLDRQDFDRSYRYVEESLPNSIMRQIATKKYGDSFIQWMDKLKVGELWKAEERFYHPKYKIVKLVYDIHQDINLRTALNSLLIKGIPHTDLAQLMNAQYSSMLSDAHIRLYSDFFWNVTRMTREDWKTHLGALTARLRGILFTSLTESVEVVKSELGLPSKVNISDSLQYLFAKSYQKARHYLRYNSPENNKEARAWIGQVVVLADKYEKHRVGDVADFSKTLQMEFDYVENHFDSPDEATQKEVDQLNKVTDQSDSDGEETVRTVTKGKEGGSDK